MRVSGLLLLITLLFALNIAEPTPVHAELVCAKIRVTTKGRPRLVIRETTDATCPKGTSKLIDTADLAGAPGATGLQGEKGETGNAGPQGIQGPAGTDGDSHVLCYARINATTDTPVNFGGAGTTNVTSIEGTNAARNIVTCAGSYPAVSSLADITVIATEVSTGIADPVALVLSGSSANDSSIAVEIQTAGGDTDFNVLVLGPSS